METSSCAGDNVLLFACSGGSNVGQISNEVAKQLDTEGAGRFYCLAGIGAAIPGMVASAQGADSVVAIDGCEVACAKATLERAGVGVSCHVIVTEQEVEKTHDFEVTPHQVGQLTDTVRDAMSETSTAASPDRP